MDSRLTFIARPALALLFAAACSQAAAQAFPQRPIHFINPFTAGGTLDSTVRLLAQKMSDSIGQPVVVENRTGAGGIVGTNVAAKAAPDGYTIVAVANNFASGPAVLNDLPYDSVRDFAPVVFIGWISQILAVPTASPVNSARELVALAKQKPGSLSYGTLGDGSLGHFVGKKFEQVAGIQLLQVPFKGSAQTLAALVGGHISMSFGNVPEVLEFARGGRLKPLAIATPKRSPLAPDLPTLAEAGYPSVISQAWYGILAPAGTPPAIVGRLNQEARRALALADVSERLAGLGIDTSASGTPAHFAALIREEMAMYASIAREANIRVSQ